METNLCIGKFKTVLDVSDANTLVYRADLKEESDALAWLRGYEEHSHTKWIVLKTFPDIKKAVFQKHWTCQHSSRKKKSTPNSFSRFTGRNLDCHANLKIKIKKVNRGTIQNDSYLKGSTPLQAVITIDLKHTHNVECADALRLLRPTEEVKAQFLEYFGDGMSVAEARRHHESKLLLEHDAIELIANGATNPPKRTVQTWHEQWRTTNFGPQMAPLEKIKEKISTYQEQGINVVVAEDPKAGEDGLWAVLVATPIMKRAQTLDSSSEVIFIDSTASVDASQSSVTVVLAATKAGAVPLCVLIHKSQSMAGYEIAFGLLKTHYPHCFGGKPVPEVFMTDNASALKGALRALWDAPQLLCHFHVAQAEWRWLLNSKNKVGHEDRKIYMRCFQKIMYASSTEALEEAKESFFDTVENEQYAGRVFKMLEEDTMREWVKLFRSMMTTRGHNTNNFSEAAMRILKDIVLCRAKAFNPAALVDFTATVWEKYFCGRIWDFALNKKAAPRLLYTKLTRSMQEISMSEVKKIDDSTFHVPSGETGLSSYEVRADIGWCSCPRGNQGAFCKHQALVQDRHGNLFPNAPPTTSTDRKKLGWLAMGDSCPDPSFFLGMTERVDDVEEGVDPIEFPPDQIIQETNTESSELPFDNPRAGVDQATESATEDMPSPSANRENEDTSSLEEAEFLTEMKRLFSVIKGTDVFRRHCSKITRKARTLRTPEEVTAAFLKFSATVNAATNRRGGYIKVQPTSLSRRREGVTRGSKRTASGRPRKEEPAPKKPRSRPHIFKNIVNL